MAVYILEREDVRLNLEPERKNQSQNRCRRVENIEPTSVFWWNYTNTGLAYRHRFVFEQRRRPRNTISMGSGIRHVFRSYAETPAATPL